MTPFEIRRSIDELTIVIERLRAFADQTDEREFYPVMLAMILERARESIWRHVYEPHLPMLR